MSQSEAKMNSGNYLPPNFGFQSPPQRLHISKNMLGKFEEKGEEFDNNEQPTSFGNR